MARRDIVDTLRTLGEILLHIQEHQLPKRLMFRRLRLADDLGQIVR